MHPPFVPAGAPRPISDLERRAMDGELRFADPRRRRWRKWALGLAVTGVACAAAWGAADAFDPAVRAGQAVGDVLFAFGVASLFLGWKRSTRRWIPLGVLAVVGMAANSSLGSRAREEREQAAAMVAMMDAFLAGDSAAMVSSAADSLPLGANARLMWANRMALRDYGLQLRAAMGEPPREWLSPAYIADPGTYPQVARYLERQDALARSLGRSMHSALVPRLHARLLQANFVEDEVRVIERGERSGIESALARRGVALGGYAEVTRAARNLHAYLVSIDARVRYDRVRDVAVFDRDDELARADSLMAALRSAQARLEASHRAGKDSVTMRLDSLYGSAR